MSSVPIVRATELGIRHESLCRNLLDAELGLLGVRTKATRRRIEEAAGAAGLRPGTTESSGRRPVVNWYDGGTGPALLLINGWTASGSLWPTEWIGALEQRFRVMRIDNRGTGWSRSAPAPYRIADLARDAYDVLRACGVEKATVLGLSMGGMIAQEFALRHPDVVERLILVATVPPVPAQLVPDVAPFLSGLRGPAKGQDLAGYFRRLWGSYTAGSFAEEHPEVLDEIVAQILQRVTPRQRVLDQIRAIRSWHGSDRLRDLAVPTTVVHGNRDPLIAVGNGMRLARLIPDADYVELAGVGHLVPHEAGTDLLRVLTA
jgi:pimeloyl-ACP methyl ester carboxylesterase